MLKASLLTATMLSAAAMLQAAEAPDTSTWAQFAAFSYTGKTAISPKADEYLNPIVAGFYPDPSICRVGDDYYLVNSSFQYFPGLPIWHSKDLVNWTQIGNVIDRVSQYPSKGGAISAGMYAPTIRYYNGTYYIVCTLVGGVGNFYVTAKDPKGPWSDPVVLHGVGGIDPSFFFDDDGKCYICNCDEPKGAAQYSGHRTIRLQEVDLAQGKVVGEQTVIVDGGTDISKHPVWCEGPHLYKINGKYYLMAAQGGTSTDHTEVIFKSDALRGPYVPWTNNPILSAKDLPQDRPNPVTCTGHADLVQTQKGEWFAVFLGCQPYEKDFFNTGRQTFLLPVKWENEWPVILPSKTPVPLTVKKPNLPADRPTATPTTGNISFSDSFDSDTLGLKWVGLRAPVGNWHVTSSAAKALFLEPRADRFSGQGNPSYLGVRQQNNDFVCRVTLKTQQKTVNCVAGLAAFQNEGHYYAIDVTIEGGRLTQVSIEQPAASTGRGGFGRRGATPPPTILATQKLPEGLVALDLQIEMAGPVMKCSYMIGKDSFTRLWEGEVFIPTSGSVFEKIKGGVIQLGQDLPSSFLSTETAGGFQGVTLGMFARTPDPVATNTVPAQANP
jgi:alpha-N-arabinofuranosidase